MSVFLVPLLLIYLTGYSRGDSDTYNATVSYYENLIETNINAAFNYVLPKNADVYRPTKPGIQDAGKFDYIVIGAGSAGAVIASRLSEIKKWKVLLLEAGGDGGAFSDIPAMYNYLQGSDLNWGFQTVPQTGTCLGYGSVDYVIVGAGAAGAVIASRLSEEKAWNILLLEAGGDEDDFADVPGLSLYLEGSDYNWGFNSTPQLNCCLGMIDEQCPVPRGRAVGGSTVINSVVYARGNRRDFNLWAAEGNPGWSYKDVLPFFKKAEHSTINGDPGYHGRDGPLYVEHHKYNNRQYDAFVKANSELGVPVGIDYNGRHQLGAAPTQFNTYHGQRDSTARAYLHPVQNRTNLRILRRSYVVSVLINNKTREAEGVQFTYQGQTYLAKARREVILSAGAIASPHILMLSGIGSAEQLHSHGIAVIQDLAVGENLKEHPALQGINFDTNFTEPSRTLRENVEEYLNGFGTLTLPKGYEAIAFYNFNISTGALIPTGTPNIELLLVVSNNRNTYMERAFQYTSETYNAIWGTVDGQSGIQIFIVMLHPKSTGSVKLKSADPFDYPLIDLGLLTDTGGQDADLFYAAIQFVLKLTQTNAFQKLNTTLHYAPLPQCREHTYLSKEYWYCYFRYLTYITFHPIGTCRMGPDPAKGAVVDHTLKVHGIKKLRVADASIFPSTTSGHVSAPSTMVGEVAAHLIKIEGKAGCKTKGNRGKNSKLKKHCY